MSETELFFDTVRQMDAQEGSNRLTKADIYGSNIGDAGSLRLAASLTRNFTLKTLNAGSNCIGDEGGMAICKSLSTNSTLTALHLHENSLGNDTVFCFAHTLTWYNASLRVLDLSSNAINDQGCVALAHIFNSQANTIGNSSLTELNLSNNHIGNAGAVELAKALRTNASLMLLDMSYCRISDAGGSSFAEAFIINTRLQTLNLSFNGFSEEMGNDFLSALTRRSAMLKLLLQGQGISHALLARVISLGPQPSPPPTKWVRPSAQGVMEALQSRMLDMCKVTRATLNSNKGLQSQNSIDKSTAIAGGATSRSDLAESPKIEEVPKTKSNVFLTSLKSVRALRAFKRSGCEKLSDQIAPSSENSCNGSKSSSENSTLDNANPDHSRLPETFESENLLQTAQVKASVIVADAHAIATDIIMEAQKHLARVLVASKSKTASFDVALKIAEELQNCKSKLGDSLKIRTDNFFNAANSSIGDSCTPSEIMNPDDKFLTPIVHASATSDKQSAKSVANISKPLGFQQCQLIENANMTSIHQVSTEHEGISTTDIQSTDVEVANATEFESERKSDSTMLAPLLLDLSAEQVERLKSFISNSDAFSIDPLFSREQEPAEYVPLTSLPFLEMEHLSEICHTENATSIVHNETTGPVWFIKTRSTENPELQGLPEYVTVKQFFEELNFYQDISFFNAIKGHYCSAVTHVLSNAGLPVGLVMEHLPLLLDDAMYNFSLLDTVGVLVQCAAALYSLHLSSIVHSNINTSSFMLSKDYRCVKFVEFAIDQCILSSIGFVHKQEPLFIAPEISNGADAATVFADIYAFGVLIWRLFHPYSMLPLNSAPIALSLAAARGSLPAFTRPGIPVCISDVCHRCMSLDLNIRPQTMADVLHALKYAHSALTAHGP